MSLAKGVELVSLKRMSEVVIDVTAVMADQVVVVSGPNLAREIAAEQPTASVVACIDHDRAVAVQNACGTRYFRPYTNTDVIGCELGGACKNVIALACGMAAGLGCGDNTLATLITRGLAEMGRLGAALGADPVTFAGLAGLGDLVATCSSPLSRNRTFGEKLGLGMTTEEIVASTRQVAEGVKSCSSLLALAEQVGVNAKTIRYYEGVGLLPEPERLPSGYRDYEADDVERLQFIRTAQRLGLSLSEIAEILAFRDRSQRPCDYVLGVLDRQVADLGRRIAEMKELRRQLIALKADADGLAPEPGCYCTVIEHAHAIALAQQFVR